MTDIKYNPTPMRDAFFIKDPNMVKLVQSIFIEIDQAWSDTAAYEIAAIINKYITDDM